MKDFINGVFTHLSHTRSRSPNVRGGGKICTDLLWMRYM